MKMIKSLMACVAVSVGFVGALGFLGATASLQAKEARWEPAIAKFEAKDALTSPPKNGILFVGSSSIVGWKVEKFFPELPVINRGFGGSQVSDVVDYFDRVVAPYEPDTIVFYSGDNDIKGGKTTTTVFNDVKKFVELVHENLPDARVILLPPKPSISRWNIYPEMKQVAELEKQLADKDPKVEFVDIATPMLGADGQPKPELFLGDKLHMTEAGYVIWSDLVRPLLTDKSTTGTQAN